MNIGPVEMFAAHLPLGTPIGLVRNAGPVDTYALCYAVAPPVSYRARVLVECYGEPAALLYRLADIFTGTAVAASGLAGIFERLQAARETQLSLV